jgi:hypothetical protein
MRACLHAILALVLLTATAAAQDARPFPDLELRGALTAGQRAYLGVEGNAFKLSDIASDYLFIEGFSMYCTICQRDAPIVRKLYQRVTEADTAGKIRFIGLGLGNTVFETRFYQKKFKVPFPLFDDEDYVIHKALGETGTPVFYIVRLDPDGPKMLYGREGEPEDGLFDIIMRTIGSK